jgi:hypothetical protein
MPDDKLRGDKRVHGLPSLTKTVQIKLTSEIGFHIKYVSIIIVSIQLHVYNGYLLLFDLERSKNQFDQ